MRIVYTDEALRDLDEILDFIAAHYPTIALPFQQRLRTALRRIGSGRRARKRSNNGRVFVSSRTTADAVEILHIHHAARRPPWNEGERD